MLIIRFLPVESHVLVVVAHEVVLVGHLSGILELILVVRHPRLLVAASSLVLSMTTLVIVSMAILLLLEVSLILAVNKGDILIRSRLAEDS